MNYLKQLEEEEEKLFRKARDYLMDNFNKNITPEDLIENLGIERRLVNKWIKEGRFRSGREAYDSKSKFMQDLIKSKDELIKKTKK